LAMMPQAKSFNFLASEVSDCYRLRAIADSRIAKEELPLVGMPQHVGVGEEGCSSMDYAKSLALCQCRSIACHYWLLGYSYFYQ